MYFRSPTFKRKDSRGTERKRVIREGKGEKRKRKGRKLEGKARRRETRLPPIHITGYVAELTDDR